MREFLAINNDPALGGANESNPSTWPIFRTSATNINQRKSGTVAHQIGEKNINWSLGQASGNTGRLVFMPTFNHATRPANNVSTSVPIPFNTENAHKLTEASGAAGTWIAGNASLVTTAPAVTNAAGFVLTTAQRRFLDDGSRSNWEENEPLTSHRIENDGVYPNIELRLSSSTYTHQAQYNLPWTVNLATANPGATLPLGFRGIMTLEQWVDLGKPEGDFWIHDTQDPNGWFYWNGYLLHDEADGVSIATSLLLEAVSLPSNVTEQINYAIYMNGEAFTAHAIEQNWLYPLISPQAIPIFDLAIIHEINVASNGQITVSNSLLEYGITANSFTLVPNTVGSRELTLPDNINPHLIRIITAGTWNYQITGQTIRLRQIPDARQGCAPTGTPDNLWLDSTGTEWCAIAEDGNYTMLISRFVHGVGQQQNDDTTFVSWPASTESTGGPSIRQRPTTGLNAWFASSNNNASPMLRGGTVHANLPIIRTTQGGGVANSYEIARNPAGLSTPDKGSNQGLPFFLSHADAYQRLGPVNSDRTTNAVNTTSQGMWWLREISHVPYVPGGFMNMNVGCVAQAGGWAGCPANFTPLLPNTGFRPGLWVRR